MQTIHTDDFDNNLDKLPKQIHRLLKIQEERFKNNWCDPRLHIKKVRSLKNAFSLRITRQYRAFFISRIQIQPSFLILTTAKIFIVKVI